MMLGIQKKIKKPWFNSSCEKACNKRKKARIQWINDTFVGEKKITYKECQKRQIIYLH